MMMMMMMMITMMIMMRREERGMCGGTRVNVKESLFVVQELNFWFLVFGFSTELGAKIGVYVLSNLLVFTLALTLNSRVAGAKRGNVPQIRPQARARLQTPSRVKLPHIVICISQKIP